MVQRPVSKMCTDSQLLVCRCISRYSRISSPCIHSIPRNQFRNLMIRFRLTIGAGGHSNRTSSCSEGEHRQISSQRTPWPLLGQACYVGHSKYQISESTPSAAPYFLCILPIPCKSGA
ncbi:hypothetical protein BDR04DRAFT_5091 [Suillus decipiens]|nr:hypothetical protein BDR04DRAFT_5091 [Suillus decipiens]